MFPAHGPGAGLVLLRFGLAVALLARTPYPDGPMSIGWAAAAVCALALGLGSLTPISAAIAALILVGGSLSSVAANVDGVALAVIATALALLGPGAYSLDARLFGRRVVVVVPRSDPDGDRPLR